MRMRRSLAFLSLLPALLGAQENLVSLRVTSEALVGLELCYERRVAVVRGESVGVEAVFGVPLLLWLKGQADSFHVGLKVSGAVVRSGRFRMDGEAGLSHHRHRTVLGVFNTPGYSVGLRPVYDLRGAEVGAVVRWNQAFLTHVRHSDHLRSTFEDPPSGSSYRPPPDGWYRSAASSLECGAVVGGLWGPVRLDLEGGWSLFPADRFGLGMSAMAIGHIPFFGRLRAGYGW